MSKSLKDLIEFINKIKIAKEILSVDLSLIDNPVIKTNADKIVSLKEEAENLVTGLSEEINLASKHVQDVLNNLSIVSEQYNYIIEELNDQIYRIEDIILNYTSITKGEPVDYDKSFGEILKRIIGSITDIIVNLNKISQSFEMEKKEFDPSIKEASCRKMFASKNIDKVLETFEVLEPLLGNVKKNLNKNNEEISRLEGILESYRTDNIESVDLDEEPIVEETPLSENMSLGEETEDDGSFEETPEKIEEEFKEDVEEDIEAEDQEVEDEESKNNDEVDKKEVE